MIRGLYTSAAGMIAQQTRLDVTANNLANTATAGFRADAVSMAALPSKFLYRFNDAVRARGMEWRGPPPVGYLGTGAAVAEVAVLDRPGLHRETGRDLDFALTDPQSFFVVRTPRGERYTRNGAFQADAAGQLVTAEGYGVLTRSGAQARADDPELVENLAVVTGRRDSELIKEGDNLYMADQRPQPAAGSVLQGVLEQANLSAVEAMVDLISAMRIYETGQKAIQTQDQTLDKLINEVGRV